MGWLYVQRSKGVSHRDFFSQEFSSDRRQVVDVAAPRWDEAYVAYETPQGVMCICVMMRRSPGDLHNFGYKDMDESMGPCLYHCPARILDKLSPTQQLYEGEGPLEWARHWRLQQPAFDPQRHHS